jgi:RHS repeat-associated protein
MHLITTRPNHPEADKRTLQDLRYTYDPAGNITHIQDDAQQTIYFRNQRVEPSNDYVYDAVYRLLSAKGREHLGQTDGQRNPPTAPDAFNQFHTHPDDPGNGDALGTYIEEYEYDAVGNFQAMRHRGSDPAHPGWTRSYAYNEPSLLEPATQKSNRLSFTQIGEGTPEPYTYDDHGNMTAVPHLPTLHWDFEDQLTQVDLQGGGTAYYVYDAGGQRVRKVIERSGATVEERIYLGGYEVYRKRQGGVLQLERQTLHVMDDKQRIALVETRTQGFDDSLPQLIRYQFGNHLGSASLELDDQAQIISYEEYSPYGSTSYQAVRSQTETPKRYRYTGMERDDENGLNYHGARYYAPWLGVWTAPDPSGVGIHTGLNVYCYAHTSPIIYRDPNGREPEQYYIEGYTVADPWGGEEEWQLFAGRAAHLLIAWDYRRKHPDHKVFTNSVSVVEILQQSGIGDPRKVSAARQDRKPDIADVDPLRELYEIKPKGPINLIKGMNAVAEQQKGLNEGLAGQRGHRQGFSLGMNYLGGELGVKFKEGVAGWRLVWVLTAPGVLQYSLQRLNPKKQSKAGFEEAFKNQWWIDVPESEMKQYAKLFYKAVERQLGVDATLNKIEGTYGAGLDLLGLIMQAFLGVKGGTGNTAKPQPGAAPAPPPALAPTPPPSNVVPLRPPAPRAPAQPLTPVVPFKQAA